MSFEAKEAVAEAVARFDRERETFETLAATLSERRPASLESVEATEARLGRPLPPLLRRVYLELADGGWGPGVYALGEALSEQPLPRHWLPLADAGGSRFYCVDCASVTGRVYRLDVEAGDPAGPIEDCIVSPAVTLEAFIRLAIPTENRAARP